MRVFVNFLPNRSFAVDMEPSDSVRRLKAEIEQSQSVNPEDQFLSFLTKPLQDSESLESYGIRAGSTVQLNMRLRGGGDPTKVFPNGDSYSNLNPVVLKRPEQYLLTLEGAIQKIRDNDSILPDGFASIEELKKTFLKRSEERIKSSGEAAVQVVEHSDFATSVSIAGNNRYLVSASNDSSLKVVDLETKQEVYSIANAHEDDITSVVFSKDSKFIVSGSSDKSIKVFDFENKQLVHTFQNVHENRVRSIALSQDNKYLVSGSQDASIKLFDFDTKQLLHHFTNAHTQEIKSVAISKDNKYIVSGSTDGSIKVFDVATRQEVAHFERAHKMMITTVDISDNNKYILSGGDFGDFGPKIWSLETKELYYEFPKPHSQAVTSAKFSNNNKYIISGSRDRKIKIFDFETKHEIHTFDQYDAGAVTSLAISSNNQYIAASFSNNITKVFDLEIQLQTHDFEDAHNNIVTDVVISKDNRYVISCSWDKSIRVFDLVTKQNVHTFENAHEGFVASLAITNDNRYIVSGADDTSIKIFDLQTKELAHEIKNAHKKKVNSVVLSTDNKYLISGSFDGTIKVFDFHAKKELYMFQDSSRIEYPYLVLSVAISSNNKYIVSASSDKSVKVYDLLKQEKVYEFANAHDRQVSVVKISHDNKYIISGSDDHTIKIFSLETKHEVYHFKDIHQDVITSLTISKDSKYIISGSGDRTMKIIDRETKKELYHMPTAHGYTAMAITLSDDNKFIAVGTADKTVEVYHFPYSKNWVFPRSSRVPAYSIVGNYESILLNQPDDTKRNQNLKLYDDLYFIPQNWTVLHLLAVFEPENINKIPSYTELQVPLLVDRYGKTPLHYLIAHKNLDYSSINVMLKYTLDYLEDSEKRDSEDYDITLDSLSSIYCFIMSKTNPSLAKRFLKLCVNAPCYAFGQNIPRFGQGEPKHCLTEAPVVTPEVQSKIHKNGADQITFEALKLHLDYHPLSDDMLKSVLTLNELDNEDFFNSKAISSIIEHLWKTSRAFHIVVALLFSALMTLISVYIGIGESNTALEVIILVLGSIFLASESLQLYKLGLGYFSSIWNAADITFFMLVISTMGLRLADNEEELARSWLYSIIIIIGYMRWMSYLRLFTPSRTLIKSIIRSLYDMWSFMLIILMIVIGFSLIFLEFDREVEWGDHLYATYNILYGDADYSEYSSSQKILLAIILFFFSVVLLNLLVSILGDSYGKVHEESVLINAHTKLEMILESTILMRIFTKKREDKKCYMMFCEASSIEEEEEDDVGGKVEELQKLVKENDQKVAQISEHIKNLEVKMNENYTSIMNAIQNLANKK